MAGGAFNLYSLFARRPSSPPCYPLPVNTAHGSDVSVSDEGSVAPVPLCEGVLRLLIGLWTPLLPKLSLALPAAAKPGLSLHR